MRYERPGSTPAPCVLTPDQTAQYSHICRAKVFALIKDGTLESVKVGRRRLVNIESIDKLLGLTPQLNHHDI
jgi:excisionase family DNA binding protein